jgi:hypothetical protein
MDKKPQFIKSYGGYVIFLQESDGFFWSDKTLTHKGDGFFDSIYEAQESINSHNYSEQEAFPEFYVQDDTPSLPPITER